MSLTAALPQQLEALADSLSTCADALHGRIMRGIRLPSNQDGSLSHEAASALFEQEVALRQQANNLYVDAAGLALTAFGDRLQELLDLAARARSTIRCLDRQRDLLSLGADLLGLAAAVVSGQPTQLVTPLKSLRGHLDALHQDSSA
jgi:hypothetical protein